MSTSSVSSKSLVGYSSSSLNFGSGFLKVWQLQNASFKTPARKHFLEGFGGSS